MIFISNFISKEAAEFWIERNKSEFTDFSITEVDGRFHVEVELNSDYDNIDEDYRKVSCWNCYHSFDCLGDFLCEIDHDYINHDRSEGCNHFLRDL